MKTILLAVDFTPATNALVRRAAAFAHRFGASLVLVRAVERPAAFDAYGLGRELYRASVEEAGIVAARELRRLEGIAARAGVNVRTVWQTGEAAEVVLQAARRFGAGWIMLGARTHGALHDLAAGSTARTILRRARCPVMIVPRP